jgi:16S rRNA (guanine527-N7)-methyltransferase
LDKLFEIYLKELLAWNQKFNLTSITDPGEIRLKHFEDSLALLQILKLTDESVVDIGAGAGFPGIPLKIVCPDIKLTLVEATRKKAEFLKHLVAKLTLKEVAVLWGRAEEIAKNKREAFDLAVSRAVAKLNILSEYCLPFVKIGGQFIAYKEENVEAEVASAQKAIERLGGKIKAIIKVKLPNSDLTRSLVLIEKIAPTPPAFPRRPGMAKKNPL